MWSKYLQVDENAKMNSVPFRKAQPNMGRAFQFVDHRDGVILN